MLRGSLRTYKRKGLQTRLKHKELFPELTRVKNNVHDAPFCRPELKYTKTVLLCTLLISLFCISPARSEVVELFSLTPAAGPAGARRAVNMNPLFAGCRQPDRGDAITFELPEGRFSATVQYISSSPQNTLSLRAQIDEHPPSFVYLSRTNGRFLIKITGIAHGNGSYTVKFCEDTASHILESCDGRNADYIRPAAPLIPPDALPTSTGDLTSPLRSMSRDTAAMPAQHPAVLSVMFLYTPAAREYAERSGGIDNVIAQAVDKTRQAAEWSGIDMDIRVALVAEVDYDEGNLSGAKHLQHLTHDDNGHMDGIHAWRDLYGADLVQLFLKTEKYGGLAWQLTDPSGAPDYGFSVVRIQQADWTLTTAHELGHNFGCHHDRDNLSYGEEGIFSYSYGYRWQGHDDRRYCTVMAYDDGGYTRLPYFSNPDVVHEGSATGTRTENNARTIRETKGALTRYRSHGDVIIGIEPEAAGNDGAMWSPDNGLHWFFCSAETGSSVGLAPGEHTITFKKTDNWDAPDDMVIVVAEHQETVHSAEYTTLGSLIVTLEPEDAADAGAQWSPDGENWFTSGAEAAVGKGIHHIIFSDVQGWLTPEPMENIDVGQGETVTIVQELTQAASLTVNIDPPSATHDGAVWSVEGGEDFYPGGSTVDLPEGAYNVAFADVDYWLTPESLSVQLTAGGLTEVEARYEPGGELTVSIDPQEVVDAGAKWRLDGEETSHSSGETLLLMEGSYHITFDTPTYWIPPAAHQVEINQYETFHLTASFTAVGELEVALNPAAAIDAGARWSYDGGNTWFESGAALLPAGIYQILFEDTEGFFAPAPQEIDLAHEETQTINAFYYTDPPFTVTPHVPGPYPVSVNTALGISLTPDADKYIDPESVTILLDSEAGGGTVFDGAELGGSPVYESRLGTSLQTEDGNGVYNVIFFPKVPFITAQTLSLRVSASDTGVTPHFTHDLTFTTERRRFGGSAVLTGSGHSPQNVHLTVDSADTLYVVWEDDAAQDSELFFSLSPSSPREYRRAFSTPETLRESAARDSSGAMRSPRLTVCTDDQLHVIWEERHDGRVYLAGAVFDPENDQWETFELWPQNGFTGQTIAPKLAAAQNGDIYAAVLLENPQNGNYLSLIKRERHSEWMVVEEFTTAVDDTESFALDTYNSTPYLLWLDDNNNGRELLIAGSVNNWSPLRAALGPGITGPAFAVEDGEAHMTWVDHDEYGADGLFYAAASADLTELTRPAVRVDDDTSGGDKRSPSITVFKNGAAPAVYDENAAKVKIAWVDGAQPVSEGMSYIHYAETGYPKTEIFSTSLVSDTVQAVRSSPTLISDSRGVPYTVWIEEGKVLFSGATAHGQCVTGRAVLKEDHHAVESLDDVIVELEPEDMVFAEFVRVFSVENAPHLHQLPDHVSRVYSFVPRGLSFNRQARITIPYLSGDEGSGRPGEIFRFDKNGDMWVEVGETEDSVHVELPEREDMGAVRFKTNKLGMYASVAPPGEEDDVAGTSGSACFIATAVYGTPAAREVEILRVFRDQCLLKTPAGRAAVERYYQWSPAAAGLIQHSATVRRPLRYLLDELCRAAAVIP